MDTMYQRGKIQEESMYYEHKKHDGSLPLIGVNTFLPKEHTPYDIVTTIELIRSTEEENNQQIANVDAFKANRNAFLTAKAGATALPPLPASGERAGVRGASAGTSAPPGSLTLLQQSARDRKNVFEQLMEAVKYNSEGQTSHALYDVGGEYRRNM